MCYFDNLSRALAGEERDDAMETENRFLSLASAPMDEEIIEATEEKQNKTQAKKEKRKKRNYPSDAEDGPKKKVSGEGKEVMQSSAPTSSSKKEKFSFTKEDRGPFKAVVSLRKEYIVPNTPPPAAVSVSRDLVTKYNVRFENLEKKNKYSWTITFRNKEQANNALSNQFINNDNCPFDINIPWYLLYRRFIIKGIPTDIDEKCLLQELKDSNPDVHVTEAYRFQRRTFVSNESSLTNTTTVKVTMRGAYIPERIFMWHTSIPVSTYVPSIRRCFQCGQLSHATKFCRNKNKCLRCGQDYDESHEICSLPPKCINCAGDHPTLDRTCPEIIKKKAITVLMAEDNLDFNEARRILYPNFSSSPSRAKKLVRWEPSNTAPSPDGNAERINMDSSSPKYTSSKDSSSRTPLLIRRNPFDNDPSEKEGRRRTFADITYTNLTHDDNVVTNLSNTSAPNDFANLCNLISELIKRVDNIETNLLNKCDNQVPLIFTNLNDFNNDQSSSVELSEFIA